MIIVILFHHNFYSLEQKLSKQQITQQRKIITRRMHVKHEKQFIATPFILRTSVFNTKTNVTAQTKEIHWKMYSKCLICLWRHFILVKKQNRPNILDVRQTQYTFFDLISNRSYKVLSDKKIIYCFRTDSCLHLYIDRRLRYKNIIFLLSSVE